MLSLSSLFGSRTKLHLSDAVWVQSHASPLPMLSCIWEGIKPCNCPSAPARVQSLPACGDASMPTCPGRSSLCEARMMVPSSDLLALPLFLRESRKKYFLDLMVLSNLPEHRNVAANIRSRFFFTDERSSSMSRQHEANGVGRVVAPSSKPTKKSLSAKCLCWLQQVPA